MAEAVDHAVDGELRDIGVGVFQERDAGVFRTDLRDGGGKRARQHRAPGDGRLRLRMRRRHQIDQVVGFQQRRQCQH